jgi:hypothetical protein
MKRQRMNDDCDSYLEPPTESRYVVCAYCGKWIDMDDAYWDKIDTPYCDEYCCEEAREGY